MPPVISVENLSKTYHLGQIGTGTFSNDLALWWAKVRGKPNPLLKVGEKDHGNREGEELWALKDVSFAVQQGEVLGIIGRNGAGKSTLLKILSRVTAPTSGKVKVKGRIASLLEVGTGFHPELTGRENIYLNGAILGMSRGEVNRKFDEIVAFAEVEKFIDTPVKRYSSGMYVRLAFAVAAHLEPEILVVDEVLAVGDVEFQKKCVKSMHDVSENGRTVLFVSHNLSIIESLCQRSFLLDHGKISSFEETHEVIKKYLNQYSEWDSEIVIDHPNRIIHTSSKFTRVELLGASGELTHEVFMGDDLVVRLGIVSDKIVRSPWIGVQIRTSFDELVYHAANREAGFPLGSIINTSFVTCRFKNVNLLPGRYYLNLIFANIMNEVYDEIPHAFYFDVRAKDVLKTGFPMEKGFGLIYLDTEWTIIDEQK